MVFCKESPKINKVYAIFLQIILTFCFLTVFFFTYVNTVERETFASQVNLVIDDLFTDINVAPFINSFGKNKDLALAVINGSLDVAKKKAEESSVVDNALINSNNKKILIRSIIILSVILGILSIITIILYFYNICIPLHIHLKNGLIAIFFVAMVEIIFLLVITKRFKSVDPSYIRKQLGQSIHNYIKHRLKKIERK